MSAEFFLLVPTPERTGRFPDHSTIISQYKFHLVILPRKDFRSKRRNLIFRRVTSNEHGVAQPELNYRRRFTLRTFQFYLPLSLFIRAGGREGGRGGSLFFSSDEIPLAGNNCSSEKVSISASSKSQPFEKVSQFPDAQKYPFMYLARQLVQKGR